MRAGYAAPRAARLVPQIEQADRAVRADGGEDLWAASKGNVINLLVVRNQLRDGGFLLRGRQLQAAATCVRTSMFQIVHVVSIDEVPILFGSASFQSNDVSGAQNSDVLFWGEMSCAPARAAGDVRC